MINLLFVCSGWMGCSSECTHNHVIRIGGLPAFNWGSNVPKPNFNWVKEVGAHTVPNGKIYQATAFRLLNDTTLLSTEALQSAIDACHEAGGGRVTVPQGDYRIGAIFLKSNVELHLEKGATLLADEELSLRSSSLKDS